MKIVCVCKFLITKKKDKVQTAALYDTERLQLWLMLYNCRLLRQFEGFPGEFFWFILLFQVSRMIFVKLKCLEKLKDAIMSIRAVLHTCF